MAQPARFISGMTQDYDFQPLGTLGIPNPLFYALDYDDFLAYQAGGYTITSVGTDSAAATPGAGGLLLLTTDAVATDFVSLQRPVASFALQSTKRLAYFTRVSLNSATSSAFQAGLRVTTATPFTLGDGIYFNKPAGTTSISLVVYVGATLTGSAVLPFVPVDNTTFDLGFVYEPGSGSVMAWAGVGLVGQVAVPSAEPLGPIARVTPTSYPTVNLNPTLALEAGTTTAKTATVDFWLAALER